MSHKLLSRAASDSVSSSESTWYESLWSLTPYDQILGFPIIHVHKVKRKERMVQKASKTANEKTYLLVQAVEDCQLHPCPKISEGLDVPLIIFVC